MVQTLRDQSAKGGTSGDQFPYDATSGLAGRPKRAVVLGLTALFTYLLHYTWEVLHAPFYTGYVQAPFSMHAPRCLLCALGDLAIAATAYGLTAFVSKRWDWLIVTQQQWVRNAAIWIAFGVLITIGVEWIALGIGVWAYAPPMPKVAGVGLTPLLQWMVIPLLTLAVVRFARRLIV